MAAATWLSRTGPELRPPMEEHSLRPEPSPLPPGPLLNRLPNRPSPISAMPSVSPPLSASDRASKMIPVFGTSSKPYSLLPSWPPKALRKLLRTPRKPRMPPFSHARSRPTTHTELPWRLRWFNVPPTSRPSRPSWRPSYR
eukprot:UN02920